MENNESIEEKINWKMIDQLHNATINFSKNSLEIKKLVFVVIGISTPLIINLCNNQLNKALFISLYIIIGLFWILDSYTYYYQKKLRNNMESYIAKIRNTNFDNSTKRLVLIFKSLFNWSHACFYGVLTVITILLHILLSYHIIG